MAKTQALISKEWHAATLDEMCGTELLHSPALISTEDVSAPLAEDVASLLVPIPVLVRVLQRSWDDK